MQARRKVSTMTVFEETSARIENGILTVSCGYRVEFMHSDFEPIQLGTPAYWDDAIQQYCPSDFVTFGIYGSRQPREKCNRVTDYKQVWGLLGLKKGYPGTFIDCGPDRLYLGITSAPFAKLSECDAPVCLLLPANEAGKFVEIWTFFIDSMLTMSQPGVIDGLRNVVRTFPKTIALIFQCSCNSSVSLTAICSEPEKLRDAICDAQRKDNCIITRRFLSRGEGSFDSRKARIRRD